MTQVYDAHWDETFGPEIEGWCGCETIKVDLQEIEYAPHFWLSGEILVDVRGESATEIDAVEVDWLNSDEVKSFDDRTDEFSEVDAKQYEKQIVAAVKEQLESWSAYEFVCDPMTPVAYAQ